MYKTGDLVKVVKEGDKQRTITISHVEETNQGTIYWDAGLPRYYYEHELVPIASETPTYTETPEQIAERIIAEAGHSLAGPADMNLLEILIVDSIEKERKVARHYMTQIGRWAGGR